MDYLGGHIGQPERAAFLGAGARLLFLPPCSPDLNPIERVFAKIKALMRKAAERTADATWQQIGVPLQCVTPSECANHLRSADYASI